MCILCVIQKWSRRVATMLPLLVIPLIGLWALSQLLPPAFRFEITSPRLACVFVLLVTLIWYEVLMPQLSSWRARRSARLKEKKRSQAIELQKLRKTATKKCRNCLSAYRDQNPGGSRFMCSYCGHNSKRPILDLPVPPGMVIGNTGILSDLVGKGGKILNGTVWTENSLMCGEDWAENGNWTTESFGGKTTHWQKSGTGFFGGDVEHCAVTFAFKLLASFFLGIRWLWRKFFKIGSSGKDDESDTEHMLAKRGENGAEFHESKSDKARRKAEEKRQARLEKKLLEEEERTQREEVARLVEERRKLRDEKTEVENNRGEESASVIEKENKKKAEKKRHDRRKDKDKGSSKSNSDVEELEKKADKVSERKREAEKKNDYDPRGVKAHSTDFGNGSRSAAANNYAGTRYLESMKGKFLSSSKDFGRGSFFGKGANTPVSVPKENRSSGFVEHAQSSVPKKELHQPTSRPVPSDPHLVTTPKKSWQHLFSRSSAAVSPSSNSNILSKPSNNFQGDAQIMHLSSQSLSTQSCDNPINSGLPSSFTSSKFSYSSSSSGYPSLDDRNFPRLGETHESLPEESELFEDPCYVPDPVFLLGPITESLNNFHLDLRADFFRDTGLEKPRTLKNTVSCEISRPSPIESPLSRLRMTDDKFTSSQRFSSTSKTQDTQTKPSGDTKSSNEMGTYHMWNSSPLGQEGLGLVDILHPGSHKIDELTFASPVSVPTDHDPWLERSFYPPSPVSESHIVFSPREETTRKEMMFESPRKSPTANPFHLPQGNCWSNSKKESHAKSSGEGVVCSSAVKPHIGGLYSTSDVHSLWSYD